MGRRVPTIEEILTAFGAEAATAVRFASVDRTHLERVVKECRRLPPPTPQQWVDAHRKFARKDVRDKQTLIAQIDTLCDEIERLNRRPLTGAPASLLGGGEG